MTQGVPLPPRWLAALLTLASCAPPGALDEPPPTETSRGGERAPEATAARVEPPPVHAMHPALRARLAAITTDALRDDLGWIVGPRETGSAHHDEVADRLATRLRDLGYDTARQPVTSGVLSASNIVGERVGADPDRVILFGAHYDSVPGSPGADDNASGVASLLAIAETLAALRTDATVMIVFFCLEESGLLGSDAFAARWAEDGRRLEVAVTLDMVGYASDAAGSQRWPDGVELLAGGRRIPQVGDFAGAFWLTETPIEVVRRFEAGADHASDLDVQTLAIPRVILDMAPDLLRSDHAPFWRRGIPAISVSDTGPFRNPTYHQPTDTMETLDLDFLARVARWLSAAAVSLAGVAPR